MAQMKLPPGAELVEDKLPPGAEDADKLPGEKELLSRPDLMSPPAVQPPAERQGKMQESMTAHAMSPTESVSHAGEGNFVAEHPEQGDTLRTGAAIGAFGPLPVAGGYLGSMLGGYGGRKLGEAAGMSPENVGRMETGGNVVGGMVGGMGGGAIQSGMGKIGSAMMRNPGRVAQTAVKGILDQPVINKFTNAWESTSPEAATQDAINAGRANPVPTKVPVAEAVDPLKQAVAEGRATKIPTRVPAGQMEPKVGAVSKIPVRPGATPAIGAQETIPVRPGFNTPTVGQTSGIPVRPGVQPAAPIEAPPSPLPPEHGTSLIPEPRPLFPGENPNYAASTPRPELERLAKISKPGAGTQLQQLGGVGGRPILYIPREAEFPTAARAQPTLSSYGQEIFRSGQAPEMPPMNSTPATQLTGPEIMDRLGQIGNGSSTVGSVSGAANDTALFQQAQQELGPGASISAVAQRAQELKMNVGAEPDIDMLHRGANPDADTGTYKRPPAISEEERAKMAEYDQKHANRNAENAKKDAELKKPKEDR